MKELPVEILEKIFRHLSRLDDVQNCFNTCIKWRNILENMFKENRKVLIATNIRYVESRYVEIIDLVNPQLQRLLPREFVIENSNIIISKLLEDSHKSPSSIVLENSRIWITGGLYSLHCKRTQFFTLDQKLINGPELPIPISGHSMVQVDAQTVYVIGGTKPLKFGLSEDRLSEDSIDKTWKFDPTNNFKMEPGPSLIERRFQHACATMKVNGKIFIVVAGGHKKISVEFLDTTEPEKGWKLGPSLPYQLWGAKMVTSPTGKGVILIGGRGLYDDDPSRRIPDFLELSGDSEIKLQWSYMTQKLKYARFHEFRVCAS